MVAHGRRHHELEIIYDDESKSEFVFEASCGRTHFEDAITWLVVNVYRGFREPPHRFLHERELFVGRKLAGAKLPCVNLRFGGEHTVDELLATHFKRENADRCFVLARGMACDVERKRGLTDRRPGGENDEV